MGLLSYSSNNSGGNWWLTDSDWYSLAEAGWNVEWRTDLGALASRCSKEFDSAEEGINEWESITGKSVASIGCNCCGPPHSFLFEDGDKEQYISPTMPEFGELSY